MIVDKLICCFINYQIISFWIKKAPEFYGSGACTIVVIKVICSS